jgi:chaperonin GroES
VIFQSGITKFAKRITPLFDRVLIERAKAKERTTVGGVVLPDSATERSNTGVVVAIGKGKRTSDGKFIPLTVKVGDTVMLNDFGGSDVKVNGKEYALFKEEELLGVLEETDTPLGKASSSHDIPNVKDLPNS